MRCSSQGPLPDKSSTKTHERTHGKPVDFCNTGGKADNPNPILRRELMVYKTQRNKRLLCSSDPTEGVLYGRSFERMVGPRRRGIAS